MTDTFSLFLHRIVDGVIVPIDAPRSASSIDEVLSIVNGSDASGVSVRRSDGSPVHVLERDGGWIVQKGALGVTEEILLEAKDDDHGRGNGMYTDEVFHASWQVSDYEHSCKFWLDESRHATPLEARGRMRQDGSNQDYHVGYVKRACDRADEALGLQRIGQEVANPLRDPRSTAADIWTRLEVLLKYVHLQRDPAFKPKDVGHDLLRSYQELHRDEQAVFDRFYEDFRYGNSAAIARSVGEYLQVIKADKDTFSDLRYYGLDDPTEQSNLLAGTVESIKTMAVLIHAADELISAAHYGPYEKRLRRNLWSRRRWWYEDHPRLASEARDLIRRDGKALVMSIAGEDSSHFRIVMHMANSIFADDAWLPKHQFQGVGSSTPSHTGTVEGTSEVMVVDVRDTTSTAALVEKIKKDTRSRIMGTGPNQPG